MVIKDGRFGPYVTDGETNASLRRGDDVESVTLQRAVELLAERRAAGPAAPRRRARARAAHGAPASPLARAAGRTGHRLRPGPQGPHLTAGGQAARRHGHNTVGGSRSTAGLPMDTLAP